MRHGGHRPVEKLGAVMETPKSRLRDADHARLRDLLGIRPCGRIGEDDLR